MVLLLLLVVAANFGVSRLVNGDLARRALAARLAAAFGRPVEVSNFEVGFLGGVRLVANYVTVGEDPRFGYEYFIRAERLSASLRWASLLRGRLEFDTVSFARPSLNLVRNPDGEWNLESWFPQRQREAMPGSVSSLAIASPAAGGLFTRLKIDAGRINFKRGVEKHPFAFVNVDGFVERGKDSSWRLDLEASMMRAGVSLQEPGTLRLRGRFGSSEDRVRPAELTLTWRDASLSDALRLARGWDFGVRGALEMEVTASAPAVSQRVWAWSFKGGLHLIDVHRWDLPRRDSDPDLSLTVEARWTPRPARLDFAKLLLEAPQSNVHASGFFQWARPQASHFRVLSAGISLDDLLDWYRAFRPGVVPALKVEGVAGLDAELGGWPTSIISAVLPIDRAEMRVPGIPNPLRLGRAVVRWKNGKLEFPATPISFMPLPAGDQTPPGSRAGQLILSGAGKVAPPGSCRGWFCGEFTFDIAGTMNRLQDYVGCLQALGLDYTGGWAVDGSARLQVEWKGKFYPLGAQAAGSIQFVGARLQPPFLNLPVILKDARLSWQPLHWGPAARPLGLDSRPGERLLKLKKSEVFGANWTGSVSSLNSGPWEFSLSADRLEVAAINQWMNPRQPQSLLQRIFPRDVAQRGSAEYEERLSRLRARGRVAVGELVLSPVTFRKLRGVLSLDARALGLSDAEAEFYGGKVRGSLRAELVAVPVYQVQAKFERVNVANLANASVTLKSQFTGAASGELSLAARGITREDLAQSLHGEGKMEASAAQWRSLDLRSSLDAGSARPGISQFSFVAGSFSIDERKLQLDALKLTDRSGGLDARGGIALPDELDLSVQPSANSAATPRGEFHLTGTLSRPRVARVAPPKKR